MSVGVGESKCRERRFIFFESCSQAENAVPLSGKATKRAQSGYTSVVVDQVATGAVSVQAQLTAVLDKTSSHTGMRELHACTL